MFEYMLYFMFKFKDSTTQKISTYVYVSTFRPKVSKSINLEDK